MWSSSFLVWRFAFYKIHSDCEKVTNVYVRRTVKKKETIKIDWKPPEVEVYFRDGA